MSWFRDMLDQRPSPAALAAQASAERRAWPLKPRLAAVNKAPDRETFATWQDHPVTAFVFAALRNAAAEQKAAWDDASWHAGEADQRLLTELRTRADAYDALGAADYEAFCEWAGVEPEGIE